LLFETVALMKQKAQSLRGLDRWIEDFLQAGRLPTPFSDKYPNRCLTCHLFLSAQQYAQYTNETQVVEKVKTMSGLSKENSFNNKVARGWQFPPLAECRRMWEAKYGGRWELRKGQ